jgi:hypothetical protein
VAAKSVCPLGLCEGAGFVPAQSGCRVRSAASTIEGHMSEKTLYVGLDVHKASISVTVAEEGRGGELRFIGAIPNTTTDVAKLARRLSKDGHRLEFCYEAGGCGYHLY